MENGKAEGACRIHILLSPLQFNELKSFVVLNWERLFFSGQGGSNWFKNSSQSALRLEMYQCCYATACFFFFYVEPQMWRLKAVSHKPAWQWCHEQQVPWIHLLPREKGGERPLKSLTHHKRGQSWGEEAEIWPICQFFHSIRADYAKEKQAWMSLLVMETTFSSRQTMFERTTIQAYSPNVEGCTPGSSYVSDMFEGTQMAKKWLLVFRAEDLRTCRQNQTEWVMMCQQLPASGFTLTNSQVCWSSVSHPDLVTLAKSQAA